MMMVVVVVCLFDRCSAPVQAKMAKYLIDVFEDKLLSSPLATHPCEINRPLPSPNDLKYKVLIKNKKIELPDAQQSGVNQPKERLRVQRKSAPNIEFNSSNVDKNDEQARAIDPIGSETRPRVDQVSTTVVPR
jgi:hypothetical protein